MHWRLGVVVLLALIASGCTTIKAYEKEYLLNPTMDDGRVRAMSPGLMAAAVGDFEKLGAAGAGASAGSSCPTCGG